MVGRECGKARDASDQPVSDQRESLSVEDEIRVVPDESARSAKMDDATRGGRHISEEMYVGHDVMAKPLLVLCCLGEVDFVEANTHFVERLLRNREPQLVLGCGQGKPQTPPCAVAVCRREYALHFCGGVSLPKGMSVAVVAVLSHGSSEGVAQ